LCGSLASLFFAASVFAQVPAVPAWRLTRELRIPAASEGLDRVYAMVVTSSGAIAVVDNANLKVSIYDSAGHRVARVGGKGNGPGEFRYVSAENRGIIGDSIWFYDWVGRRLVVHSAQGKVGRTTTLTTSPTGSMGTLAGASPMALLPDGSMIQMGTFAADHRQAMDGADRAVLVSRSTEIARVLGRFEASGASVTASNGTMTSSLTIPFVFRSTAAASSDGAFVAFVAASRGGPLDTVRLSVVRSSGDTAYTLQQLLPGARIPDSIYKKAKDMQLSSARKKGIESQVRGSFLLGLPRFYPAVESAFITRDGRVWLRLHPKVCEDPWPSICEGPTSYRVISPAGKVEAVVAVPTSITLADAYGDRVWGFEEDEDGFRNIVRFRLIRTP
jgi:hypothetical protein